MSRARLWYACCAALSSMGSQGFVSSIVRPCIPATARRIVCQVFSTPDWGVYRPDSSAIAHVKGWPSFERAADVTGTILPSFGKRTKPSRTRTKSPSGPLLIMACNGS